MDLAADEARLSLLQSLAYRIGGLASHTGQHVAVSVEGDRNGGVP